MPSSSVCWGIEIGASAIKAIKLEAADEGVKVLEYAVIQHPKPLSTPGVDANDVLRVSLGTLTSQHDLSKATIAISVPGHVGFARSAKLPPVEPKKVPDIVKFEAMQQIPFPLDQVEWDYQTFVSPDSPEIEVGIFAITKERVNERLAMLADFGISPSFVVLSPIAVYNALAYDLQFAPDTPGTIIVDVGTTSTDLVVATPGRMWVRTFPIGGHQFTEALVNQFQLSYPKAEKLKREAEDSKHARQVFQAMRPVFTDLAQDIQRSIGYYQSVNKDAQLTRLIGVGSTFALPGLRKYLKQQLSIDVYRVEEFRRATMDGAKAGDEKSQGLNAASLSLCTAYGLALQGLGLNSVGGNLMPASVLRKAMWKEKVPMFGLAAGVALLAGGVMFIGPARDYFEVKGYVPDPVINTALSAAEREKSAAASAGVTQAPEPDYNAANMITLMDRRGVYTQLATDVASMLANANERAGTWAASLAAKEGEAVAPAPLPAFTVKKFNTLFEPPMPEETDPNLGGMTLSPGQDPLGLAKYPRVKVTLELSTGQPEPYRFAAETIQKWLAANATREGVPFTLKFTDMPITVQAVRSAGGSSSPAPEAARPIAGGGGGVPPGRGFAPGGSKSNFDRPSEEDYRNLRPTAPIGPAAGEGGPQPTREDFDKVAQLNKAIEALNTLSPITEKEDASPATGVITVTFWAAFIPPAPAAEGGAN